MEPRRLSISGRTIGRSFARGVAGLATAALCALGLGESAWAGATSLPRQTGITIPCPEGFCSSIDSLTLAQQRAMTPKVWRKGCPVALADLRVVTVKMKTFGGLEHFGTVVVHRSFATSIEKVFHELYDAEYPIESMTPIEAFDGDDDRSTLANNSSAFNCRPVSGRKGGFSEHSYGRAIDINPVQNPYVRANGVVLDPAAKRFVDRAAAAAEPGVIASDGPVVKAFARIGWKWGGNFRTTKDYQHFSSTGR